MNVMRVNVKNALPFLKVSAFLLHMTLNISGFTERMSEAWLLCSRTRILITEVK